MYSFTPQTPSHPGCHLTKVLTAPSCPLVVFTIRLLEGDAILGGTVFHSAGTIPKSCSFNAINHLPVKVGDFPTVRMVKNLPAMQETQVQFLGQEDPVEKEMTTYSSILAWRIPWTEELSKLPWGCKESDTT